jgi:hypothetical protein
MVLTKQARIVRIALDAQIGKTRAMDHTVALFALGAAGQVCVGTSVGLRGRLDL